MIHLREPQAHPERVRSTNRVDRALLRALGLTSAALLYIAATQIPFSQNSEITPVIPPTETLIPTPTSSVPPTPLLSEILQHNLKSGHPFREIALEAFHRQGYEITFEHCRTGNSEVATATVLADTVPVRKLPNESSPALAFFKKGDRISYRLLIQLKHWNSNQVERSIGIEDDREIYSAAALRRLTQYIKNDPGTECVPALLPGGSVK